MKATADVFTISSEAKCNEKLSKRLAHVLNSASRANKLSDAIPVDENAFANTHLDTRMLGNNRF